MSTVSQQKTKRIVVLTGAGISAESGISTFRDGNGLWDNHAIEDVATPEGYAKDPALVQRFYNTRRAQLKQVKPNLAHEALARLEQEWQGEFLLVTQNVDDLHERAGSQSLIHMHGELLKHRCEACSAITHSDEDLAVDSVCPRCNQVGCLRPHIVWFGEIPLEMERIAQALSTCDVFVSIGTSGNVYPAAGFFEIAQENKAKTVELNLDDTLSSSQFDQVIQGVASQIVPSYVDSLLG